MFQNQCRFPLQIFFSYHLSVSPIFIGLSYTLFRLPFVSLSPLPLVAQYLPHSSFPFLASLIHFIIMVFFILISFKLSLSSLYLPHCLIVFFIIIYFFSLYSSFLHLYTYDTILLSPPLHCLSLPSPLPLFTLTQPFLLTNPLTLSTPPSPPFYTCDTIYRSSLLTPFSSSFFSFDMTDLRALFPPSLPFLSFSSFHL